MLSIAIHDIPITDYTVFGQCSCAILLAPGTVPSFDTRPARILTYFRMPKGNNTRTPFFLRWDNLNNGPGFLILFTRNRNCSLYFIKRICSYTISPALYASSIDVYLLHYCFRFNPLNLYRLRLVRFLSIFIATILHFFPLLVEIHRID